MQVKLLPTDTSAFELSGFLIRGERVSAWILELQNLGVSWTDVRVYPLPGPVANSIWGCLVLHPSHTLAIRKSRFEAVQGLDGLLFIPERSTLLPMPMRSELAEFVHNKPHLLHPDIGFYELREPLDVQSLLQKPEEVSVFANRPVAPIQIPTEFTSFFIRQKVDESVLANLERNAVPEKKSLQEKPLNALEKIKLAIYQAFLPGDAGKKNPPAEESSSKSAWGKALDRMVQRMVIDLEELERRNAKAVDRLLQMLKDNPEEALKYAMPLGDEMGRGSDFGEFRLGGLMNDLSLFGTNSGSGGTMVIPQDQMNKLRQQYYDMALKLIDQGEFEKAAYVYLKLLKEPWKAGPTLENGGLYKEAAYLYHQKLKDLEKAAACYERVGLYENALEIRSEQKQYELCGDLLMKLGRQPDAMHYYQRQVDVELERLSIRNAAKIYLTKMNKVHEARLTLREGWRKQRDTQGCLDMYASTFEPGRERMDEIQRISKTELSYINTGEFLEFLKTQYKETTLKSEVRELAYPLISQGMRQYAEMAYLIPRFNPQESTGISRDVMLYIRGRK